MPGEEAVDKYQVNLTEAEFMALQALLSKTEAGGDEALESLKARIEDEDYIVLDDE